MKLDVAGLSFGYLVNPEGSPSKIGPQTGLWYCGRNNMEVNEDCDGYCGPNNGPNCDACERLQMQANTRYKSINHGNQI